MIIRPYTPNPKEVAMAGYSHRRCPVKESGCEAPMGEIACWQGALGSNRIGRWPMTLTASVDVERRKLN